MANISSTTTKADLIVALEQAEKVGTESRAEVSKLIGKIGALEREQKKLRAVARHYQLQRGSIDGYLSGVLDTVNGPADESTGVDVFTPPPKKAIRAYNTTRPQVTEPAYDKNVGGYNRELELIDWEK